MKEFLQFYFDVQAHISDLVPNNKLFASGSNETMEYHSSMILFMSVIRDMKQEIENVNNLLNDFEKHVVWGMYYNHLDATALRSQPE